MTQEGFALSYLDRNHVFQECLMSVLQSNTDHSTFLCTCSFVAIVFHRAYLTVKGASMWRGSPSSEAVNDVAGIAMGGDAVLKAVAVSHGAPVIETSSNVESPGKRDLVRIRRLQKLVLRMQCGRPMCCSVGIPGSKSGQVHHHRQYQPYHRRPFQRSTLVSHSQASWGWMPLTTSVGQGFCLFPFSLQVFD